MTEKRRKQPESGLASVQGAKIEQNSKIVKLGPTVLILYLSVIIRVAYAFVIFFPLCEEIFLRADENKHHPNFLNFGTELLLGLKIIYPIICIDFTG